MEQTPETENKQLSLTERMKLLTETKKPTVDTNTTFKQQTNTQTNTVNDSPKKIGNNWNFKDDFESTEKPTQPTETTQQGEEPKKITTAMKQASARTAVGMLDFTQKLILRPIANYKFKKKFTSNEINRISEIDNANKATLSDEDLKIRNKWDKLLKKHIKITEAIPLNETEEKDLEKIFFNYFDIKEKTLDPGYLVAFGIINCLGKRAIDVFIE